MCHYKWEGTGARNPFGQEVEQQLYIGKTVTQSLVDIEGTKTVRWRLEVWGRVRGWVNFGHPFPLTVTGVRAVVRDDPTPHCGR